jgi:hypothetical protein
MKRRRNARKTATRGSRKPEKHGRQPRKKLRKMKKDLSLRKNKKRRKLKKRKMLKKNSEIRLKFQFLMKQLLLIHLAKKFWMKKKRK